jgi:hypothetical protein
MVFAYSQVIRIAAAPDYAKIIRPSSAPFCRPMKAPHGSLLFGNIGLGRVSPYRVLLLLLSCALAPLLSDCSKRGSETLGFGPQEVLVADVIQQDVPVVREWMDRWTAR